MSDRKEVVCLGNGESRKGLNLDKLITKYTIYGCNGLYREFTPDIMFCNDGGMTREIQKSGYAKKHEVRTRRETGRVGNIQRSSNNLRTCPV